MTIWKEDKEGISMEAKQVGFKYHEPCLYLVYKNKKTEKIRRRRMPIRVINRLLENDIHQVSLEEIHEELLSRHNKYLADLKKEQIFRLIKDVALYWKFEIIAKGVKKTYRDELSFNEESDFTSFVPPTKSLPEKASQNITQNEKLIPTKHLESTILKADTAKASSNAPGTLVKSAIAIDENKDLNKLDDASLNKVKLQMEQKFKQNLVTKGDPSFKYDVKKDFGPPVERSDWDSDEDSDGPYSQSIKAGDFEAKKGTESAPTTSSWLSSAPPLVSTTPTKATTKNTNLLIDSSKDSNDQKEKQSLRASSDIKPFEKAATSWLTSAPPPSNSSAAPKKAKPVPSHINNDSDEDDFDIDIDDMLDSLEANTGIDNKPKESLGSSVKNDLKPVQGIKRDVESPSSTSIPEPTFNSQNKSKLEPLKPLSNLAGLPPLTKPVVSSFGGQLDPVIVPPKLQTSSLKSEKNDEKSAQFEKAPVVTPSDPSPLSGSTLLLQTPKSADIPPKPKSLQWNDDLEEDDIVEEFIEEEVSDFEEETGTSLGQNKAFNNDQNSILKQAPSKAKEESPKIPEPKSVHDYEDDYGDDFEAGHTNSDPDLDDGDIVFSDDGLSFDGDNKENTNEDDFF